MGERIVNALSVDVEEYFHPNAMDDVVAPEQWDALPRRVEDNTRRLLDLLAAHEVHATFFVLGWVAERSPDLVRDIAARGHEVACHGHAHRLAYRLGPDLFRADVLRAKAVLEDVLGVAVHGFRAASWSIVKQSMWAFDTLIEAGFAYDSSVFPIHHDRYGMPEFSRVPVYVTRPGGRILEIPASTVRLAGRNWPAAGGGYLRLLPFGVTRWALRRLNDGERIPAMVYVHPWEIDPLQPRLPAGWLTRARHYGNLHRTAARVERLLRECRFAPLRVAFAAAFDAAPDATLPGAVPLAGAA